MYINITVCLSIYLSIYIYLYIYIYHLCAIIQLNMSDMWITRSSDNHSQEAWSLDFYSALYF